jgi:DNA modification methylase
VKTERVTVASLLFDPANVRKHGERNLDAIKASLARFGQQKPIVVDSDGIVRAGNGTLMAAKALGWDEIEIVRTNLRGSEATAYAIADNRTAELAEWDEGALAEQLAALQIDDEALAAATGFDASEIERMALPVEVVEDEVPEVPADPITKPGNLWLLGEHRVLCGDSTKAEDVARLMDGAKADACVTDPPFAIMGSSTGAKNDPSLIRPFFRMFWRAIRSTGAFDVYMFCDWRSFPTIHEEADGWDIKDVIVWDKKSGGLGNPYRRRHEFIVFARPATSDKKMMGQTIGGVSITDDDVWQCERVSDKEHNAQKPLPIVVRCIENSTKSNGLVFEPCGGSGTTLIAAEQLGRKCYGMEISPAYCDVIVKRWETLTGKKATLAA